MDTKTITKSSAKSNVAYVCIECGSDQRKWIGRCPDCQAWNSMREISLADKSSHRGKINSGIGYSGSAVDAQITKLNDLATESIERFSTGLDELDRVLGGGVVPGSVILLGGDPGIGKSTILLQALSHLSHQEAQVLYVTGEESLQQVKLRAVRLGLPSLDLDLLAETQVELILKQVTNLKTYPRVLVIDSIQTLFTDQIQAAPGAVSQLRESAALLTRFAKQTGVAIFLVGHVTKEGVLAGPRVLEHMVDTVLYFEGQSDSQYRMLRAVKNRFGAVNELGVFAMGEHGLQGVKNPSAIFLSARRAFPGSVVMVAWEGTRPFLVEVQALVDDSPLANPRRVTLGLEPNRLALSLAVLSRHGQVSMYNQDVYINIVGGVRITETAADLPVIVAVLSSMRNRACPEDLVVFGEVGLSGEIRPVQNGIMRLKEAEKHGFKRAIVPAANFTKKTKSQLDGTIEVIPVSQLSEVLEFI